MTQAARQVLSDLAAKLETLDRGPFRQMLAALLGVRPTRTSLQRFANKSPDRWAQALSVLGALSGYERGALFQVNLFDVKRLSDAELLAEAQRHGVTIDAPSAGDVTNRRQLCTSPDVSSHESTVNEDTGGVSASPLQLLTGAAPNILGSKENSA